MDQNSPNPVLLIVRDPEEWPSDEFVTLFREEGYETRDVNAELLPTAVNELKPFGVIVLSNMATNFLEQFVQNPNVAPKSIIIYDPPPNSVARKEEPLLNYPIPIIIHFAGMQSTEAINASDSVRSYVYEDQKQGFANPSSPNYNKPASRIAYTRTLKLLRDTLGPTFDLEKIWDEHCDYEFNTRDVAKTMETMVAQPYVNHVPTMTGGVGYDEVSHFYQNHFIYSNPPDMKLSPISRTVGTDRIVDELVVSFTHTTEIDWILPGVPPTGKAVKIPLVAIVNIRGGKLYHEHIYWDQASVLHQIGLLEIGNLPIAGVETAMKVMDESSVKSNQLIREWKDRKTEK